MTGSDGSPRMLPDSWFGRLTAAMNAIGSCLIVLVMMVMLADIFGRFFFNHPIRGVPEIVAMSLVAIVFLQIAHTLRAGRVIFTDGFLNWLAMRSVRAEQALLCVYHVIGAGVFGIIIYAVMPKLGSVFDSDEFYGVVGSFTFPKWPLYLVILFGSVLMCIQYLALAVAFCGAARERRRLNADLDPAERVVS